MSRSVKEWIGKSDDTPVPDRVRIRVLERFDRCCAKCGTAITDRNWVCDHIKALINGGENRETNLQPLGRRCGCVKEKDTADVTLKSQSYRVRRANYVRRKPKGRPMPGTRASGVKKCLDGTVVDRKTGRVISGRRP